MASYTYYRVYLKFKKTVLVNIIIITIINNPPWDPLRWKTRKQLENKGKQMDAKGYLEEKRFDWHFSQKHNGIMIAQTVNSKETLEVNDKIFPKPFR